MKESRIFLGHGLDVRLGDLGTLNDGRAEIRNRTRLDGKPALTFQIVYGKGTSEVEVAHQVEARLAEIQATRSDLRFRKIVSFVTFTEASFEATLSNFIEGAVLTVLVMYLFLRDRRATLIGAVAIPLSILPTFLILYWLGFSLNTVSLLGISLVTGVLVDDAIVEIENIHRHMREGRSPYEAAGFAADEIGLAVIATTFVLCAVFVPVSFMPGISGRLFLQFGLTVAIASMFSLIVARLLTPMLSAYLPKPPSHDQSPPSRYASVYRALVQWTLDHRLTTLGLALVSLGLSFGLIPLLSTGFIPYEDISQSRLTLESPPGVTLEQTDEAAQRAAVLLLRQPEVEQVLTNIGSSTASLGGGPGGESSGAAGINVATLDVKLVPSDQRPDDTRAFEARILPQLQRLPDVRVHFESPSGEKDVAITLVSDEVAALIQTAEALEQEMRDLPQLNSISTTASLSQPEIRITPDLVTAARLGISVRAISEALSIGTLGDLESNLAKFNAGSQQIPIRVRLPRDDSASLDLLRNLSLPTAVGGSVSLSTVADITFGSGPTSIQRVDRQREITVQSIGGAFVLLLITGTDFSMPVLIGILMLMGIADKNSILLVDHMLELQKRGHPRREAIVDACLVRARPILMTSLALLAGMLPTAWQLGLDTALRAPMAIAVMGGLISLTVLSSLVFVPVLFSLVSSFEDWLRPLARRMIS